MQSSKMVKLQQRKGVALQCSLTHSPGVLLACLSSEASNGGGKAVHG